MRTGDIVEVQGKTRWSGCRLTLVGRDACGWWVLLNSTAAGGYIRVREVAFVRSVSLIFDPRRHDPVLHRGWIRDIENAQRATGARVILGLLEGAIAPCEN